MSTPEQQAARRSLAALRADFGREPLPGNPEDIQCVTRDPGEPAAARYLAVCTGRADLIARSRRCVDAEAGTGNHCGGHLICRPCFDLAVADGSVVPDPEAAR
jgi:hypothetical protein